MTFTLAKKLFETGYRFYRAPDKSYRGEQVVKLDGVLYLVPTLEELMHACGGRVGIEPVVDYAINNQQRGKGFIAYLEAAYDKQCFAKTPLEAVARLWFALNKPK